VIILQCDGGCRAQSPDAEGSYVADSWVRLTVQRQSDWERSREKSPAARATLLLCPACLPLVEFPAEGEEVPEGVIAVRVP
jgi:hypothetical protein